MMAFQASAANYFGFNASGQLVDVSIEDGYGSKRIGLRFPTAELVSTGCYMPKTNSVDLAVDMRKARAAGVNCRIPDDWIDTKRYALFMARDVMRALIDQMQSASVPSSS